MTDWQLFSVLAAVELVVFSAAYRYLVKGRGL